MVPGNWRLAGFKGLRDVGKGLPPVEVLPKANIPAHAFYFGISVNKDPEYLNKY